MIYVWYDDVGDKSDAQRTNLYAVDNHQFCRIRYLSAISLVLVNKFT